MHVLLYVAVGLLCAIFPAAAVAAEADFFVVFSECKNVTAPLVLAKDPIRIMQGDPTILSCTKGGEKITGQITFEKDKKE